MRVLIAIDDSPCSLKALDAVAERVWTEGSKFRIVSVVELTCSQYEFCGGYVVDAMVEAQKALVEGAKRFIDTKVDRLRAIFGKENVEGQVLEGFIADQIVAEAVEWSADLIMVGSHGRRGVQKFLLGSVAEKVCAQAPCSVEIVKQKLVFPGSAVETSHTSKKLEAHR